ncbi:MAG: hypothetical protein P8013_12515 [Candidatus Sulfobium sp.]|jgi:hypothetical protein
MNFFSKIKRDKDSGEPVKKITMQDVLDNLPLLEGAEKSVSEFYLLCAEAFPEDRDSWLSMASSELRHAENIRKMSALIKEQPRKYRSGYPFQPAAIRAFVLYLEGLVEKMKNGEIPRDQVLPIAAAIEESAAELHYADIVETSVDEFNRLAREIDGETAAHRSALDLMIRDTQGD